MMPSVLFSPAAEVLGGVGGFSLKKMITNRSTNDAMIAYQRRDYATWCLASSL
jgi:hypothetical protein